MNIFRKRVFTKYPQAKITYGSITTPRRKELELEKSHENDAIAISGIKQIDKVVDHSFKIKQFRKKKRSLHEATARKGRKEPNRTQRRNAKNTKESRGFFLNDKVEIYGKTGFISGFSGKTVVYVKDVDGEYITKPGKASRQVSLKECTLISHNNNWQMVVC